MKSRRAGLSGVSLPTDQMMTEASVLVALDELGQLLSSIDERKGGLPLDSPIDGNLRPDEHPQLVGEPHCVLVVRVVCKTHAIGAELLRPTEQDAGIVRAMSTSGAERGLFVDRYPPQEDSRAARGSTYSKRLLYQTVPSYQRRSAR
jgi:hypothetical protein